MNGAASKSNPASITPAVHLEFIQNQLDNPNISGHEEVENYQRALFLHQHAVEWENYREQAKVHQERLSFLEGRLRSTELVLSDRTHFLPVNVDGEEDCKPNLPWNGWDIAMFVACGPGIVCLITFCVLNISFNLLESGFITFRENPFRSYLWAALLPVGALAVKVGWDVLQEKRRRDLYLWGCLGVGIIGVLVWIAAYACVYPTLSKGINEQIASLTLFDSNTSSGRSVSQLNFAGAKWIDAITVAGQAMAEIFLSAVLGMYLTCLYARHRPVRLARDPAFAQLETERRTLEQEIARERLDLSQANGNLVRLENQLAALIAYGKSLFHRETARRQDQTQKKQVILDQLSEHLRTHIEGAAPANRLAAASTASVRNGD